MIAAHVEQLRLTAALARRGLNEILRVPGASIPGILAPTIYMVGTIWVFGSLVELPGFGGDYLDWVLPVGFIQAAAFTGAATGVNLARDIESGWFDRVLLAPISRWSVLGGLVASAALRVMLPSALLLICGLAMGLQWPGLGGTVVSLIGAAGLSVVMAFFSCGLAMKFRSQDASPLMQSSGFMLMQLSTVYAPMALLAPWLQQIARINPFTYVLDAVRAPYIGSMTWHGLWIAAVALIGMIALSAQFAAWRIRLMDEV